MYPCPYPLELWPRAALAYREGKAFQPSGLDSFWLVDEGCFYCLTAGGSYYWSEDEGAWKLETDEAFMIEMRQRIRDYEETHDPAP